MLRSVVWWLVTDVSGQPIPRLQEEFFLDCAVLEEGGRQVVPERRLPTTDIRCVTSQKSDDLSFILTQLENFLFSAMLKQMKCFSP